MPVWLIQPEATQSEQSAYAKQAPKATPPAQLGGHEAHQHVQRIAANQRAVKIYDHAWRRHTLHPLSREWNPG